MGRISLISEIQEKSSQKQVGKKRKSVQDLSPGEEVAKKGKTSSPWEAPIQWGGQQEQKRSFRGLGDKAAAAWQTELKRKQHRGTL